MKERVILLIAGESGSGKSFFVANLQNALIFDTDIGGGLAYADARIKANNSERIEVGSYIDVIDVLSQRQNQLKNFNKLSIDHLSTLHQESVLRHNPRMVKDFGSAGDKAAKEWRKVRELVRWGDFHLICTSHLKGKWEEEKVVGEQADAAKKIEGDFHIVLHAHNDGTFRYPMKCKVHKWRRDPDDPRGKVPSTFPLSIEAFAKIHGYSLNDERHAVPMATTPQVIEIQRLISVVKMQDGMVAKWMAKAKAESWEDFTQTDLQKCIDYLTGLMKSPPPTTAGNGAQQREPGVEDE